MNAIRNAIARALDWLANKVRPSGGGGPIIIEK